MVMQRRGRRVRRQPWGAVRPGATLLRQPYPTAPSNAPRRPDAHLPRRRTAVPVTGTSTGNPFVILVSTCTCGAVVKIHEANARTADFSISNSRKRRVRGWQSCAHVMRPRRAGRQGSASGFIPSSGLRTLANLRRIPRSRLRLRNAVAGILPRASGITPSTGFGALRSSC